MVAAAPTCTPRCFVALDSRPSSPKLAHGHTYTRAPAIPLLVSRLRDSAQRTAKLEIGGCMAFRPGYMCCSVAQPPPLNPQRAAIAGDTPRPVGVWVGAAEERANLTAAFGGTIQCLGTRRANLVLASPSRARSMPLQVFAAAVL